MSWACFWNFLLAGILALTVPSLTKEIKHTGVLGLFAGLVSDFQNHYSSCNRDS